CTTDFRASW
nr:immunoglobulin heavy chain junction region [Macaca mulatta]MOY26612.1 immunoglobulin heavy chain junction region [Macaca mulatta]MOY29908.1 immunoglobulin heavy chain junction region [Macaca mulatta]MOY30076.1 immunoglobulin heavy chain junction region [Macaca mulatta]MOY30467.1 immunoglobulin heavy chain junction region [Macaca mulatta]